MYVCVMVWVLIVALDVGLCLLVCLLLCCFFFFFFFFFAFVFFCSRNKRKDLERHAPKRHSVSTVSSYDRRRAARKR